MGSVLVVLPILSVRVSETAGLEAGEGVVFVAEKAKS